MFPVCFGMSVPAATLAAYCALLAATAACGAQQPTQDVSDGTAEAEGPVQEKLFLKGTRPEVQESVWVAFNSPDRETTDGTRQGLHTVLIPFIQ
jgi:hypothetical protein